MGEGPANNDKFSQTSGGVNNQQVIATNNQFAYIKTKTKFTPKRPEYFFRSKLFWSSLFLPLLAIPLAIGIRRKKAIRDADFAGNRMRRADKLAKKYLSEAKKSLGNKEAFYVALEKALHNYLKAKFRIETSDLSKEKIIGLLNEKRVKENVISEFLILLKSCELARYTPFTDVEMQLDYDKAAKTISIIDKQIR